MKKTRLIVEYVEFIKKYESPVIAHEVPTSLLWTFLSKIANIGLEFQVNLSIIKGYDNSLNSDEYMFMVKTGVVDKSFYYLFEESKILNTLSNFLHEQDNVRFYLGINSENMIEFGALSPDDKLPMGYCAYNDGNFKNICKQIEYNQYFQPEILSNRFKTNIRTAFEIKNAVKDYFHADDDITTYTTIIDNKFTVIIESLNDDVINQNYLEKVIREYCGITRNNWTLSVTKNGRKTFYYIYVK